MNLVQLEYLVATVRAGNFSEAARELFVTPQTVSKALGSLEAELGVPLFSRDGKRLSVTDEGRLLAERARDVLASCDDVRRTAARLRAAHSGEAESLTVAVASEPIRGQLVPESLLSAFRGAYPGVELTCLPNASEACLDALHYGIADAAITLGYTTRPGLRWTKLYPFAFHLTIAPDNPLAERERIHLADLVGAPIATPTDFRCTYRIVRDRCEEHGIAAVYADVLGTPEAHRGFLEEGGVIFTSAHPQLAERYPELVVRPFEPGEGVVILVCLVWCEDSENPAVPALERFLVTEVRRKRLR